MRKLIGIMAGAVFGLVILGSIPCQGQTDQTTNALYGDGKFCESLEKGDRIRVTIPGDSEGDEAGDPTVEKVITGTLRSCGDGLLVFEPDKSGPDPMNIPMHDIRWLEVSHGRSSNAMPGAAIGLVVGILISIAARTNHHQDEFLGGLEDAEENIGRGAAITIVTTLVGGIIGSAIGSEQWKGVEGWSWDPSLSSSGGGGDFRLAVGCSF